MDVEAHRQPYPAQAHPGLHAFAGSHDVSVGSFSATNAGRDVNIQNITNNFNSLITDDKDSVQAHRETMLKYLTAPNFDSVYSSALEQRMAQTGTWLLELPEFVEFVGSKGVTLWCTGMPGAGKTVLASIVVNELEKATEELESPCRAIAFAFLRYSERYTWQEILTSLVIQLVRSSDLACATFWPIYSRVAAKTASKTIIISSSDLERVLRDLAGKLEMLYVVIDGLDEAGDEVKDKLLEVLVPSGVNLLILSRPLDPFTHHAPNAFFVSIQAQTEDIDLYVRTEVQRSSRLQVLIGGRPETITELCEKIARQSEGMFLVAKLQMEVIKRSSRSVSRLFSTLEALPVGINAMYDHTLGRIRDSDDASIAFRVFAWVLCAHPDVLSPHCLQQALSFDTETMAFDKDDITPIPLILSACQGLVVADETVRFIHYSTYEYMKKAELDSLPDPHFLAAITCLACMDESCEDLTHISRSSPPNYLTHSIESYLGARPLLTYSHQRWAEHVSSSQPPESVDPYLEAFLARRKEYPLILPSIVRRNDYPPFLESIIRQSRVPRLEIVASTHLVAIHGRQGCFNPPTASPTPLKTKSEPRGYTPFHIAAMYGRFETFQLLLSSYSGAYLRSEHGQTVLHVAVEYRQTSFIEQLCDLACQPREQKLEPGAFGFDPYALDSEGMTPLMLASHDGEEEVVRMLLSCEGVNSDFHNDRGETVLHYATRYQDFVSNLTFNIGRHGDIEEQDRMAKFLCSIPHIDVNARDDKGNSPFMLACQSGLEGTVEYMLDNFEGRPPFAQQINNQGQTAMMLVCQAIAGYGHGEAVFKLLVASGSDLHAQDANGVTPFLGVLKWHPYQEFYPEGRTVKLLTELLSLDRTLIDQRDHCGRTALIIAVQERGDDGAASWVLAQKSHDAEFVNARDNGGMSAFLHACHIGAPAMVEALLGLPCVDMYQRCGRARSALDWLFRKYYAEKEGVRVFQVLKRLGEWGERDIQNMFLRALASPTIRAKEFTDLWTLTSDAFTWDLECTSTVLLLASASLKYCRIYPALVLLSLGLLPQSSFDFGRDGMGVCVDRPQQPEFWHSQTHENFRSAIGALFPGQGNDNDGGEQCYTHVQLA